MDDSVRQTLLELREEFGLSLLKDPDRLEAYLHDLAPGKNAEIHCLVSAVREGVLADMQATSGMPTEAQITRLSDRLHDRVAMEPEAARWAVESLAQSLSRLQAPAAPAAAPTHPPDQDAAVSVSTVSEVDPIERSARRRTKRILLIAATITLAAAVAVAAIVVALPMQHASGPTTPAPDRGQLLSEGQALAALDASLKKNAAAYGKSVTAIKKKARKNKKAVAAWEKEWRKREAHYEAEKAAVESYNSNPPSTPATWVPVETVHHGTWAEGGNWVTHDRRLVPGYTAPAKPLPPPPEKPPKVRVRLKKERRQLAALTQSLREIAALAAQASSAPQLAATEVALGDALGLLQRRVDDARTALRGAVTSRGPSGTVIDQKQIASITVTGIAEAIEAVRATLLQVLQSQGIDPNALTAPSPAPALSSASPGPSSSAAAP